MYIVFCTLDCTFLRIPFPSTASVLFYVISNKALYFSQSQQNVNERNVRA